jgi:hypothetical protein
MLHQPRCALVSVRRKLRLAILSTSVFIAQPVSSVQAMHASFSASRDRIDELSRLHEKADAAHALTHRRADDVLGTRHHTWTDSPTETRSVEMAQGMVFEAAADGRDDVPFVLMLHGFGVSQFFWNVPDACSNAGGIVG